MSKQFAYGLATTVDLPFRETLERVRALLKEQGFGILCEIDVAQTMKEKAGADFRPYVILGACNPQLAHQALSAEEQLGLLLPCNLVVQYQGDKTVVSAVDAAKMLDVVGNPALRVVAEDANTRLRTVIDKVENASL
jgi:uncharacterized protein (DUF302 family)